MSEKKPIFVIHKHAGKPIHYDFRLQIGDKLVGWAMPKGPTLDPKVKRLGREIEPQNLDFALFEGEFEEEKYGQGSAFIWDEGTFVTEKEIAKGERIQIPNPGESQHVLREGLTTGEIKFILEGSKLKGSFALVKTKGFPPGVTDGWLLIKHRDEFDQDGYEASDHDQPMQAQS